jgi:hypothetical protein
MIALVFLVSIAVLDFVLRRPMQPEAPDTKPAAPDATDVTTPGLFHLGEKLDQYGRGQIPTAPARPALEVPESDPAPKQ